MFLSLLVPLSLLVLLEFIIIGTINTDPSWELWAYLLIAVTGYLGAVLGLPTLSTRPLDRNSFSNFLIGFSLIALTQKVILTLFFAVIMLGSFFFSEGLIVHAYAAVFIISLVVVIAMIYGITYGKYRYVTEDVALSFIDLPTDLEGLNVVHISDIHAGTWDSIAGVKKGIKLIQDQNPDLILFTGDLVNTNKDEIDPFIHLFASLEARYGKYAVLGNHDYYGQPRERELRPAYYEDLYSKYDRMGFDLMLNDSRTIDIGSDKLHIVGVENWGHGRYFPKRGDLDEALSNVPEDEFIILMSHDPSHWNLKVKIHPRFIPLTLSGHTHGMQFGINLPFFKWSPVQYRYKQWMGLYESEGRQLYVNRGFGLLGYPGRVGMSPEVTVLRLKKA